MNNSHNLKIIIFLPPSILMPPKQLKIVKYILYVRTVGGAVALPEKSPTLGNVVEKRCNEFQSVGGSNTMLWIQTTIKKQGE